MSFPFTIYEEATGRIITSGICPVLEEQWLDEGEVIIEGAFDPSQYFRDGELVPYPEKENSSFAYDYERHEWFDPRDDEGRADDFVRAQGWAIAAINRFSGDARAKHVTAIVGQDMVYLAKEAEAISYLSDPNPVIDNYPMLQAEIGITAPDAASLAQVWLNMGHMLRQTAARLENIRLGFISQIEQADDEDAINSILTQAQEEMSHA